ncbi:MAG: hypothetical protein KF773_30775 [Deltaproteobacteria bacterium]|nr:hypothetical protein [Deltaproteobacteria bacterium]
MVRRALLLVAVAACGDNAVLVDAAPRDVPPAPDAAPDAAVDAPPGTPDLKLIPEEMAGTLILANEAFGGGACEVIEGCVGGPGLRRLLKFDTVTANGGTGDLVLGAPPADGASDATFTWSACHGHHHVTGYARYELLDDTGLVVAGHKQAFCLQDTQQVQPGAGSRGYNCMNQGMSVGWADVYARSLPCQWIDVTGVAPGTYTLRVVVNPEGALPDADPDNNVFETTTTL